mgnify:FL=1
MDNVAANHRGVSIAIETVILVSVIIAVSIATTFWSAGVANRYFQTEKVEIVHVSCDYSSDTWMISVSLKNTGGSDVRIEKCLINELEVDAYGEDVPEQGKSSTDLPKGGLLLFSGGSASIMIYIDGPGSSMGYGHLSSGTSINVSLITSSGIVLSRVVELVG